MRSRHLCRRCPRHSGAGRRLKVAGRAEVLCPSPTYDVRYFDRSWGQSGHALLRCTRPLLTQSGHSPLPAPFLNPIRWPRSGPRGATLRRRDFIKVIGGAAATWPVAAWAQQAERTRRIGVLSGLAESDLSVQPMVAAFEGALAKLGWTRGGNVVIEYRWGGSDADTIRRRAAELVALAPDVIFVSGGRGLELLLQATRSV